VFFLKSLKRQKDNLEDKASREHILLSNQPQLAQGILDLLRTRGQITMGELETLTGQSRHRLRRHLANLVRDQLLRQHGKGKGTWYTLS
jgi:predicted HTH transcriptional regulator